MRSLREDERDEIESVKHLIKHVITKPNIEGFKIWEAVLGLSEIAEKYVVSGIVSEEELNELTDIDDVKELITKLMGKIVNYMETGDTR